MQYVHASVNGGKNISPGFIWTGSAQCRRSRSRFRIVDPHPVAKNWVHWFVIDIPFRERTFPEGASGAPLPTGAKELLNSYDELGYGGPAPPTGSGVHPYVATVYALNVPALNLPKETALPSS